MNASRVLLMLGLGATACHSDRRAASTSLRQYYECVTVAGPPTSSVLDVNPRLEACVMSKGWSHDSATAIAGGYSELLIAGLTETSKHGKAAGDSVMKEMSARGATEARIETMKFDLRNLVVSEERYFADSVKYTTIVACSGNSRGAIFCSTQGTTLGPIRLTKDGFTATITHADLPGVKCAIFVGSTPIAPAKTEALPTCQ
jgi:hypothetical protein